MEENEQFQRVSSYELMVEQVYMAPEDTPGNAPFVLVKDIMQRLAQLFPTFSIGKNTDREIGKRLLAMGYQYKRHAKGLSYQMEEMPS